MNQSKAAVFRSSKDVDSKEVEFDVRAIEVPTPESGELVVRVLGCTLCRSDLHTIEGRRKSPMPTILGHEMVGVIESIGPDHSGKDYSGADLAIGDRITWAIVASCGQCELCQKGVPQKCLSGKKYGHRELATAQDRCGGLSEHCLLFENSAVFRLPDEIPLEVACPANCATATVASTLRHATPNPSEQFAVFGVGMLGLTACAMLRSLGVESVIAVDVDDRRLERALEFGATKAVQANDRASISQIGIVDCALEYSGNWNAVHSAFDFVRNGGRVVLAGSVFPSDPLRLTPEDIVRKNLSVVGVHNYQPDDLKIALDFLESRHADFPFAELVSSWFTLDELESAIDAAKDPENIRVGIRFAD